MASGWLEKETIDGQAYYYNEKTKALSWDKPIELFTADEREQLEGEWTWAPDADNVYVPARIIKQDDKGTTLQTQTNQRVVIPASGVVQDATTRGKKKKIELWPLQMSELLRPSEDLVMMSSINEAMILHNLRTRFLQDHLYTYVGAARTVLVSVNPFKNIPNLYGPDMMQLYYSRPPNRVLAPHVYSIGADSYRSLLFTSKNQSVLISGESGAGKTVATKQVLEYLANVSESEGNVHEKILVANPLLETYGNAQTIRNNNSSRFGKYIQVYFSIGERKIMGASITNYLLEKSRVVHQQANSAERNFHIFYQLTKLGKYGLSGPQNYRYTSSSGTYDARDIDDEEWHAETEKAMNTLDFTEEEQDSAFRIAAAILNLGNIEFAKKNLKGGVTGSKVVDDAPLKIAAELLEVSVKKLEKVLTNRSITVKRQTDTIPLNPEDARHGTDSLSMGLYGRLFSWLVQRVNESLHGQEGKYISILDIFGFEIFEQNSFEQLLINFANEKLQQQFNRTTFKEEEALYAKEGIDFTHIEFIDNQIVLDLVEGRPAGILLQADDEIKIPEGSDAKLLNKIEATFAKHPRFQTEQKRKLENSFNFEIEHYAGIVRYNGEGFLEKNRDTLYNDMSLCMSKSKMPLLKELFEADVSTETTKLLSLSYQFRTQLNQLMTSLDSTESRYIRTIKSNADQKPNTFESPLCLDQLRYSGVFEAVEIRKTGYPFRYTYASFACRYMCINEGHRYRARANDFEGLSRELLDAANQDVFADVQFGKTLVLYRHEQHQILELMRNLALEKIIPKCQRVMRGHLAREMKRRCFVLEARIQKALDVGNDLDMLSEALDSVDETIGELRNLFPGVDPRNREEGLTHRERLEEWKKIEKEIESLLNEDPNKVYYDLAAACEAAEALEPSHATKHQLELVEQAKEARASCELGKIDLEAKESLALFDRERMEAVLQRANDNSHNNETLTEIKRWLKASEIEFVQEELRIAKEAGDERRRIHREIRYKELFLEDGTNSRKYGNIAGYEALREPMDFAKPKFMGKAKAAQTMLVWTKSPPPNSLQQTDDKMLVKEIIGYTKLIRTFMGDKKSPDPNSAAAQLINAVARANNFMRDEIYLQLIKQLTQNPNPASLEKGFDLMALCLAAFTPSDEFEYFLLAFLKSNAPNRDWRRFTAQLHQAQYGKPQIPSGGRVEEFVQAFREGDGKSEFAIEDGEPSGPSN